MTSQIERPSRKLVVATDEAGYGPQLGPLVIGGSCWAVPDSVDPGITFGTLGTGFADSELGNIKFNDSKTLFSPKKRGLSNLESAVVAIGSLCNVQEISTLRGWLELIDPGLPAKLAKVAWLRCLDSPFPISIDRPGDWLALSSRIRDAFANQGVEFRSVAARVIHAREFNKLCDEAGNKATLLSEQTVRLVIRMLDGPVENEIEVFSDKHGGRAYYGGLLQHFFPDASLEVIQEGRSVSRYRITDQGRTLVWNFTAKGDAFPPVAFSSMVAKYTRERLMGIFNEYWGNKVEGLKPTAGYPGDAGRFLRDIAAVIDDDIRDRLVRNR